MTPKKRWLLPAIGLVILWAGVGEIEAGGSKKGKKVTKNQHPKQLAKKNKVREKVVKGVNAAFSKPTSNASRFPTTSRPTFPNRPPRRLVLRLKAKQSQEKENIVEENSSPSSSSSFSSEENDDNLEGGEGLENQTGRVLTSGLLYRPSTWLGAPVVVAVLSYISWQKFFAKKAKPENRPKPKTE